LVQEVLPVPGLPVYEKVPSPVALQRRRERLLDVVYLLRPCYELLGREVRGENVTPGEYLGISQHVIERLHRSPLILDSTRFSLNTFFGLPYTI
jgi:hypothetical protein